MRSSIPLSLAARERLREHHAATAKAVAVQAAVLARLGATTSHRAEVLARQDALVAAAEGEVARALAEGARVMGIDVAPAVLGMSKAEVRRMSNVAEAQ